MSLHWILCVFVLIACKSQGAAPVPTLVVARGRFARVVEVDGYLRPVQATKVVLPKEAPWAVRMTWLAEDGSNVKKGDVLVRLDDLDLREQLASAREDHAVAAASGDKEQAQLRFAGADRRRTLQSAQNELALTRAFPRKDHEIFSRNEIIESEIDGRLKEAMVAYARKSAPVEERVGRNKIAKWNVDADKAQEAIDRAHEGLRSLSILAPHDGVFSLRRNGIGEPIRVGDTAFRGGPLGEVALLKTLEVEAFVLEVEAAGLAEGRTAEVVIESQPGQVFAARVKSVEAVTRRRQQQSPTQYFGVVLSLDRTDPAVMKPGQRVVARLHLNELKAALVVPRPAVFDQDGKKVVYRLDRAGRGGSFLAVPVVLGPSTAGRVTIESGLREGDVIALSDPGKAAGAAGPAKDVKGLP